MASGNKVDPIPSNAEDPPPYKPPRAPITTQQLNPGVYQASQSQQVVTVDVEEIEREGSPIDMSESTCCDKAWHCNLGYWLQIPGKGPAWWPFMIVLYILFFVIAVAYCLLATACCILRCFLNERSDDADNVGSCYSCFDLFTTAMVYATGCEKCGKCILVD